MPRFLAVLEGGEGVGNQAYLREGPLGIRGGKWVIVGSTMDPPHLSQHGPFVQGEGGITEAKKGQKFS